MSHVTVRSMRQIKIISYKEKSKWNLQPKYNIGNGLIMSDYYGIFDDRDEEIKSKTPFVERVSI